MQSSAELLFRRIEKLYENIYNLLAAFQDASSTNNKEIYVDLKNEDDSISHIKINSFQTIQNELTRLSNNFASLTSTDSTSYILSADGSISMQEKVSFFNAEYIENIIVHDDKLEIDHESLIEDLISPTVKLPIEIQDDISERNSIACRIFEILLGYDEIQDNPSILNLEYLYNIGKIDYKEINRTLNLTKQQVQYYGKYTIESITQIDNNISEIILDNIYYTGLNIIGDAIELKIGDLLVTTSGASKYIILDINRFEKKLHVQRIAGTETLKVGLNSLLFNEVLPLDGKHIVSVPILPAKKYIIFLSTENFKNISYPSVGIKVDTSTYKVIHNEKEYTLDDFFSVFVTNFTEYLTTLMYEAAIPLSLGVVPNKPVLNPINFKVVQINKHLNDSKTAGELTTLQKSKQKIQNEIDYEQAQINQIQESIDTQKYNSQIEKDYQVNKLSTLKNQVNILKVNLLTITRDIDNNAIQNNLKNAKPKFRVLGFWDIQRPIPTPQTKPQHIIKYDVQYRYLSKNADVVNSTTYQMIDENGKKVSVSFSPWNNLDTVTLSKIKTLTNEYIWDDTPLDSSDTVKINQCAISINENESVEIRIRAVSEAGYPISSLRSEWSESIRVEFPVDLKDNSISSIITQNNLDLSKAEFNYILDNYGILKHIASTLQENEKIFFHDAKNISSGQYTAEQKNIPLDVVLNNIITDISILKKTDVFTNLLISIVDFTSNEYQVVNNSTVSLFGGNYFDNISIYDPDKWGSIIRLKGYIKIKNNNNVPIELKTLVPGVEFNSINAPSYYNVPISTENQVVQNPRQVIYFRNKDITDQSAAMFQLVKTKYPDSKTYPDPADIIINALDSDKKIIYKEGNDIKICKLRDGYTTDFNGYTTEHPLWSYDNRLPMVEEFNRLKQFTQILKEDQVQSEVDNNSRYLGFQDADFFAIGQNTTGAYFYPVMAKTTKFQVIGNTTTSTLIIPSNSELLVPLIYEYRMVDRFGNINGIKDFDVNHVLEYTKKIGADIMINNEIFKFDIIVNSRLKSKVVTFDQMSVQSITNKFKNEDKEILY